MGETRDRIRRSMDEVIDELIDTAEIERDDALLVALDDLRRIVMESGTATLDDVLRAAGPHLSSRIRPDSHRGNLSKIITLARERVERRAAANAHGGSSHAAATEDSCA